MFKDRATIKIAGLTVIILTATLGILRILFVRFSDIEIHSSAFHSLIMVFTSGLAFFNAYFGYRFYLRNREPGIFILALGFYIFGFTFLLHTLATPALPFASEGFFDATEHYGLFLGAFLFLGIGFPLGRLKDGLYGKKEIVFGAFAVALLALFSTIFFYAPAAAMLFQYADWFIGATAFLLLLSLISLLFARDMKSGVLPYLIFGIAILVNAGIAPFFYKDWNAVWWYFHLTFPAGFAVIFAGLFKIKLPEIKGIFQAVDPQKRLSVKFSLFVIFMSVIPLLVSAYLIFIINEKSLEKQAVDDLVLLADSKRDQLNDYLSYLKSRTLDFSSDGLIRDLVKENWTAGNISAIQSLNRHLEIEKMSLDKNIIGINIINTDGRIIASTYDGDIGRDESGDEYFIKGLGLSYGETFLSDIAYSTHFGLMEPLLVGAAPLFERLTSKRLGMITVYFQPAGIDRVFVGTRGALAGRISGVAERRSALDIYLVNKDNLVISKKLGIAEESRYLKEKNETKPVNSCKGLNEIQGVWDNGQGIPVYGASMCLPVFGWTLLVETSQQEVFKPIKSLQRNLFFVIFSLVFLVIILAGYFSRNITKPLAILTSTAQKIKEGNLAIRADIVSEDEVGILAQSFNAMTDNLIEAKAKDEAILASISDAVVACGRGGEILLFNYAAEELTGFSAKEVIGGHYGKYLQFTLEGDGKPGRDFIAETINTGKKTEMTNHILIVKKDGRKIPVANSAAPLEDARGEIIGCVAVFRDISKEREIDKMKTEFISIASHQLKTPLTAIGWITERLLGGKAGKFSEKQKDYLETIYNSNTRMVKLVNDLLSVSRLEEGSVRIEAKPLDLEESIEGIIKTSEFIRAKKRCQITFDKPKEKLPSILMDESLIRQIIGNLLINAARYSIEGSCQVEIKLEKRDKNFLLTISDKGIGIPEDKQRRIFEKFFRADNAQRMHPDGTGLGLYIVKMIVGILGGKIWFESPTFVKKTSAGKEEIGGTTFYVELPLSTVR